MRAPSRPFIGTVAAFTSSLPGLTRQSRAAAFKFWPLPEVLLDARIYPGMTGKWHAARFNSPHRVIAGLGPAIHEHDT
jgi:arylsulfatase A-like enzyme